MKVLVTGGTSGGFVPYGPSRAGSEALSRVMAADLRDTDDAAGVHDERIVAVEFERWLRDRNAG